MTTTEQGLLVAFGRLAEPVGRREAFGRGPIKMQTVEQSPADKLADLLAHILAGGRHRKELRGGPRPLVADRAVARAWGQEAFASASGVSALLRAASDETVAGLPREVRAVLAPDRRQSLSTAAGARLVVAGDLTSLVVSDPATTDEGAEFGSRSAAAGPGQGSPFARAQLQTPSGSYVLGGFLQPGQTVSVHCLRELVELIEAELGRPRRRVEALDLRSARAEQEVADLDAPLAERQRGHSVIRRRGNRLADQGAAKRDEIAALRERRDALAAEQAAHPAPRRILLRLAGGFGDAAHLAWLDEPGSDCVARPHTERVGESLREEPALRWAKVSKNGFLAESRRTTLGKSPDPVRRFAARQWRGDAQPERWSALVTTPELDPTAWPVRRGGTFSNGRQTSEAGIQESQGVCASRPLPTRHEAGLAVSQELVRLAQHLVRWCRRLLGHHRLVTAGSKEIGRVGATSRAVLLSQDHRALLQFADASPWRGLRLPRGPLISSQLWFDFLEDPALAGGSP